jgi:uncharacterized protein YneF (UPF0154 family)
MSNYLFWLHILSYMIWFLVGFAGGFYTGRRE